MPQGATIESLARAFRMMKAMQAQGSNGVRTIGGRPLTP